MRTGVCGTCGTRAGEDAPRPDARPPYDPDLYVPRWRARPIPLRCLEAYARHGPRRRAMTEQDALRALRRRLADLPVLLAALLALLAAPLAAQATLTATDAGGHAATVAVTVTPQLATTGDTLPALPSACEPVSPHCPSVAYSITDFYYNLTDADRAWAAQHFDMVMSGNAATWKAANPSIETLRYTLQWMTITDSTSTPQNLETHYLDDMGTWFAAHPTYDRERAFLHDSLPADSVHRSTFTDWGNAKYIGNPADPGWRAYTLDRYRRLLAASAASDGVFLDAQAHTPMAGLMNKSVEFAGQDSLVWQTAVLSLLDSLRRQVAPGEVMLNAAGYAWGDFDQRMERAAGASHLETLDNPQSDIMPVRSWPLVDSLLAHGVRTDFVALLAWEDWATPARDSVYGGGNYAHAAERIKIAQWAAYLMVVPDSAPRRLRFTPNNLWKAKPQAWFLPIFEMPLGFPHGARRVAYRGTDPVGQQVVVYERDLDSAIVLLRPVTYWRDTVRTMATRAVVPLPPGGPWAIVLPDRRRVPVDTLRLMLPEAVVLVRR